MLAVADKILAACLFQCLNDQRLLLGTSPLEQRALQLLFVVITGGVNLLARAGVYARVVHAGGEGAGSGIEVLHLLGSHALGLKVFGQTHGILQGGAGVGGHQIGHYELLLVVLLVQLCVLIHEALVNLNGRLAHVAENAVDAMLGSDLQLTADVMAHELSEEVAVLVLQHVVKADAGADENLFDSGYLPQLAQQGKVVAVVCVQIGAGRGGKTAAIGAHALFQLLGAGCVAEIGGGAANVMDVTLEEGMLGEAFNLFYNGFVAAGSYHAALVESKGTEVAAAETASVVDNGEAHFLNSGYAAHLFVHGVVLAGVGKSGNLVKLLLVKRHGGGIDYNVALAVLLNDSLAADGVMLGVLNAAGLGVSGFIAANLSKGGNLNAGEGADLGSAAADNGAAYIVHLRRLFACLQAAGDLTAGGLTHAVYEKIGARVNDGGAADFVLPIIIVSEAAQGCLHAADDKGQTGESLAHAVCVNDAGAVGTQSRLFAGTVKVLAAAALGGGVVSNHGVKVARREHTAVAGAAHGLYGLGIMPVGLGQKRHAEAVGLQQSAYNGRAERRVIHVGIARYQQKIIIIPATGFHVLAAYGEKQFIHGSAIPFSITITSPKLPCSRLASVKPHLA